MRAQSHVPKMAARAEPTASITERMSSVNTSKGGMSVGEKRSEHPKPLVVRDDQSGVTRQRTKQTREIRTLPVHVDMRAASLEVEKVDGAFPDYLVGERDALVPRIAGLWGFHDAHSQVLHSSGQAASCRTPARLCPSTWAGSCRPLRRGDLPGVHDAASRSVGRRHRKGSQLDKLGSLVRAQYRPFRPRSA